LKKDKAFFLEQHDDVDWEPGDGEHDGDNGDESCHTLLVLKENEKLVSNCIANALLRFMYSQNETARPRYFQNRIIIFCLPISTFMYL
jgi:hypothetical protein